MERTMSEPSIARSMAADVAASLRQPPFYGHTALLLPIEMETRYLAAPYAQAHGQKCSVIGMRKQLAFALVSSLMRNSIANNL